MKKIITIFTVLCIFCMNCAASVISTDSFTAANGWTFAVSAGENACAEIKDGNMELSYNVSGETGKAAATKIFDASEGNITAIAFAAEIAGKETANQRKVSIMNNGTLLVSELLNFKGDTLTAFGTTKLSDSIEENHKYEIAIAFDKTTNDAVIYLDGVKVYEGNPGTAIKKFDYGKLQVEFKNYTTSKNMNLMSKFVIGEFAIGTEATEAEYEPANGAEYVNLGTGSAVIKFNGIVLPVMYDKMNYVLKENDDEIDFIIEKKGTSVLIRPIDGFKESSEYKIAINTIKDILGNDIVAEKEIVFTTMPEGYSPPSLSISADKTEAYEGQCIKILPEFGADDVISKVVYFVDGIEAYTAYSDDYSFEIFYKEGEYEITAKAYDSMGAASEECTISVVFRKNEIPEITSFLNDGETYTKKELSNITLIASDSDGFVSRAEIYSDGELYEEIEQEPFTANLSKLEKGWHDVSVKVYDDRNTYSEKSYNILVTENFTETVLSENNMDSYTGGAVTSVCIFYGDAQMASSKDFGEEHGTVCRFFSEGVTTNGTTASNSFMQLPTGNMKGIYRVEMDLNFVDVSKRFYFMLKQPGESKMTYDVGFQSNGTMYLNGGADGNVYIPYEFGKWYHIAYEVNLNNCTYNFYIDGEQVARNFSMVSNDITNVDFRFIMETQKAGVRDEVAIDNLKIISLSKEPFIASVGDDENEKCDKVLPYTKKIRVNINGELDANSLTKDTVKLMNGEKEIGIGEITYSNNTIYISLISRLSSRESYSVIITKDARKQAGGRLADDLKFVFSSDMYDIDVTDVVFTEKNGKVTANGMLYNRNDADSSIYVLISTWDGTKMTNISVKRVELNGNTEFTTSEISVSGAETLKLYFLDSLTSPKSIGSKIYIK